MAYNFLHTFQPQSIAFSVGSLAVHWYGICIVLGIVSGLSVALRVAEKYNIKKDDIYDVVFYVILGSLIGARIYAVLLFLPFYLKNPSEIIQVWHGGLAIHGAIIGGALTLLWYVRKKKKFFWQLADIFAPALALGQAVGRWGNYFNQELYGKPSDAPWAIPIELHNRVSGFEEVTYFHPTFLYESLMNFGVFLLLLLLHKYATGANHKPGITNRESQTGKSKKLSAGSIAFLYLILYSVVRIIMEQFRIDETPEVFGIRLPVFVSLLIILASVSYLFARRRNIENSR